MNIALLRQPIASVQAQWLVLGIFEDDAEPPPTARGTALEPIITRLIGEKDLTGSLGELTALYELPGSRPARSCWSVWVRDGDSTRARRFRRVSRWPSGSPASVATRSRSFCPRLMIRRLFASALIEGAIAGTRGPGRAEDRSGSACL